MNKKTSSVQIIVIILVIIVGGYLLFKYAIKNPNFSANTGGIVAGTSTAQTSAEPANDKIIPDDQYQLTDVIAPGGTIHAFIADTDQKEELGLGYRQSLPPDGGMIFAFDNSGIYDFWMENMKFPLDIVWIGADKKVVGVVRALSPETYPNTVSPSKEVAYVLEINSGAAANFDIATGTELIF